MSLSGIGHGACALVRQGREGVAYKKTDSPGDIDRRASDSCSSHAFARLRDLPRLVSIPARPSSATGGRSDNLTKTKATQIKGRWGDVILQVYTYVKQAIPRKGKETVLCHHRSSKCFNINCSHHSLPSTPNLSYYHPHSLLNHP